MAKYGVWKDGLFVGMRSETKFKNYKRFVDALDTFSSSSMQVTADVIRFQQAYQQSNVDSDLPNGFEYKQIEKVRGKYRLCQIYVGPNNNFRALVMFLHNRIRGQLLAYWVYAFKKQRKSDHPQIERAKTIARECWNSLERG